jgi:hypothetical protein
MFDILANALAGRAALWSGDPKRARDAIGRFEGRHTPLLEAERVVMAAGLAAIESRPADALPLCREALRAWRDLGLAWDETLCELDMAIILDPADQEVRVAADSAREILTRRGAKPFLARLEAAMGRHPSAAPPEPAR